MKYLTQSGSTPIVIFIAVIVVAMMGVISYQVANLPPKTKSTVVVKTETVPASIESNADLKQAIKALDNTDIDGSVNPSSLDNDQNAIQ